MKTGKNNVESSLKRIVQRLRIKWKSPGLFLFFFLRFHIFSAPVPGASAFPVVPTDSQILPASMAEVAEGEGWLTETRAGSKSMHMHGEGVLDFDLSSLQLEPGFYQVGLIARTGTRWSEATSQIGAYRLRIKSDAPPAPRMFKILFGEAFQPFLDSGEKGSWGNWFGTVQAERPLKLEGGEILQVENRQLHGGVVCLWVQKVSPGNAVNIQLEPQAAHHAFGEGQVPAVKAVFSLPAGLPAMNLAVSVEWLDLLTGSVETRREPLEIKPGLPVSRILTHPPVPGVHRLRVSVTDTGGGPMVNNPSEAHCLLAFSGAKPASGLPDDWPLGAHVDVNLPPLPGFRWYRYFAMWPEVNPQPGVYDWSSFDRVVEAVRQAGGRLFIASDGSPIWTSSRGKAGMGWSPNATAYPPDDPQLLYQYLTAMLNRYADDRGTLGALELCNEANTSVRWLGTAAEMVELAKVFRKAVDAAPQNVKLVGMAVSAGDHRKFVHQLIDAGLLEQVDAVSAHFYEELMSHDPATPINNLPRHVDMLREPMREAGRILPMINSESGIEFVPRERDRLVSQNEINARAESSPSFSADQPWMLDGEWRRVSERRAAASYVTGTVLLLANEVSRSFYYSQYQFMLDGAPSFPWVALGQLGSKLEGVDFHQIRVLPAQVPGSEGGDGERRALAFMLGAADGSRLLVAWSYQQDTRTGRSMLWQPWVEPAPVRIHTGAVRGEISDLYDRRRSRVESVDGVLTLSCGEEPVFVRIHLQDPGEEKATF